MAVFNTGDCEFPKTRGFLPTLGRLRAKGGPAAYGQRVLLGCRLRPRPG